MRYALDDVFRAAFPDKREKHCPVGLNPEAMRVE
jgi:hypothetical protein